MLMVLAIIPMLIVFVIFSKQIIKGITLGSVKG
jgi:multiple sugar transport system permease protein